MPMLANAAFYYRSPQEIYLENFNLIDVEIDGSEQHSPSYDVGAKGTYLQYFRQCMFLRCNVHDTGATGIGNDYPDRSFVLGCQTDNCGRLAPDGSGGASGIGIGLGAIQDEALIVAQSITRNCKNFGMFFEQQRLSG
ncbi:TPA: right-handed parallel beta-helix repeat-containing protein, partial [Klebsiella variicola subsp. variicola]|nr:right-handed parallel beta-helix repeat-containing protein [Klebsiella variicola subsp. variicola]